MLGDRGFNQSEELIIIVLGFMLYLPIWANGVKNYKDRTNQGIYLWSQDRAINQGIDKYLGELSCYQMREADYSRIICDK